MSVCAAAPFTDDNSCEAFEGQNDGQSQLVLED